MLLYYLICGVIHWFTKHIDLYVNEIMQLYIFRAKVQIGQFTK